MRRIIAVIIGVLVANIIFFIIAYLANYIHPTPQEYMDSTNPEIVATRVAEAPMFTWFSTLFGISLGVFIGSMVGVKIVKENIMNTTITIGLIMSLWAFYTFYIVYPDVLWVPVGMFLSCIVFSYFVGHLARTK